MGFTCTATAVAVAVNDQCFAHLFLQVFAVGFGNGQGRCFVGVSALRRQVRSHFTAIRGNPFEGLIGEGVGLVPAEFYGCKIVLAHTLDDLRKGARIAEDVRQPHSV